MPERRHGNQTVTQQSVISQPPWCLHALSAPCVIFVGRKCYIGQDDLALVKPALMQPTAPDDDSHFVI